MSSSTAPALIVLLGLLKPLDSKSNSLVSESGKTEVNSTPLVRFFQKPSIPLLLGKRPDMPIIAISKPFCSKSIVFNPLF